MYALTYDAARAVFAKMRPTAGDVLADRDGWATTIANRAVADPDDLSGRFAFLATVEPAAVAAADRTIFADGDHRDDTATRDYGTYTDFIVWHVVHVDAHAMLGDVDQLHALLSA